MSRLRILILIIFPLFGPVALVAQKNACSYTLPVQYTFGYNSDPDVHSVFSNDIITTIADDEVKPPDMISFTLNSVMKVRISAQEGKKPSLVITLGPKIISGHTQYRKFAVEVPMMPNRLTFGCSVQKKDGSSVSELPQVTGQNQTGNESSVLQCRIPHFSCDSDSLVVHNLRFYFDEAGLTKFKDRVNLINDYYAANTILDTLDGMVRDDDFSLIDNYPSYFIKLEEMNKVLTILKEKNFVQGLNLDSLDPAGFRAKYERISGISAIQTSTFLGKLKMLGVLNLNFSKDTLVKQFLDGISRYIRWSLLVTERNSSIYQDYLDRYFHMKAFKDDKVVIRDLVKIMYPAQNIDSSLVLISKRIHRAYRSRAEDLIKNHQYTEVLELLKNADNLFEVNPSLKGKVNDQDLMTLAANGIYDSFLSVADYAILDGKQEMSRGYIAMAQNFKKDHAGFVTADSLFNKVFKEVTALLFSKCDTLYNSLQYFDALDCYNNCDKGFDPMTASLIRQKLEYKAQFCKYKVLISDGTDSLENHDIREAFRKFFLARQISRKERFPHDSVFESLCRTTFPEYLIPLLQSGEELIVANHLDKAKKLCDSIVSIFRSTGITCSNEFSLAMAQYQQKIEEKECWNISSSVSFILLRSQRERELKKFISSALSLDSVKMLIEHNPECSIQYDGLLDTILQYAQAVDFQKLQNKIDRLFMSAQFDKTISNYPEMERNFSNGNIVRFGLDCIPLYDYVQKKSRDELTISALRYFREKKNLQEAFRYLKMLRLHEYPKKKAAPILESMGKEFARKDFHDQPNVKPDLLVLTYIGQDPWMAKFKSAYVSEARHLRH